jgi:hypothetical protein
VSLRVVISQSNYLPWKGYFDLIHDADLFLFLDDVQYTKNSWRNRNRLKGPNGPFWLTIPVGGSITKRVCDIRLPEGPWARAHWRTIRSAYGASKYFNNYSSFFADVYERSAFATLSELNQFLIRNIARQFLGIKTQFASSREFDASGTGQERVLNLLKSAGATTYISGPAGKAYLDEVSFLKAGIKLCWKDYSGYPEYEQLYGSFEHEVSILDVLCCTGPLASYYIWEWRSKSAQSLSQRD